MKEQDKKEVKRDTNFTNNDPLDAVIRKMSNEPERLTYDQVKPVIDKKIEELTKSYTQKQADFHKKYDESSEKKQVITILDSMKEADKDLTISLTVESIECRKMRSNLGMLNHLLGTMNKKITYPLDSIEKIEKL